MKIDNTESKFTSPYLQKFFLTVLGISFAMMVSFQIYNAIQLYVNNPNISSYFFIFLSMSTSVAYFISAFAIHTPTTLRLRAFDSALMATCATALYGALDMLLINVFQKSVFNTGEFGNYMAYGLIQGVFILLTLIFFLVTLRRSHRW